MKTIKSILFLALLVVGAVSCKKNSSGPLGGSSTPMSQVGNTFSIYPMGSMPGVGEISAEITELEDGISNIEFRVEIENDKLEDIIEYAISKYPSDLSFSDGVFTGNMNARITDKGMSIIFEEGELIGVKYDAKLGDVYTLNMNGDLIRNEVISKSTDDDFFWSGGFMIKVTKVESSGFDVPGLDKVVMYYNHRFGLVGVDFKFIGGTSQSADVVSASNN
jgi:hypothetical protein